jgi:uncharacterized protein
MNLYQCFVVYIAACKFKNLYRVDSNYNNSKGVSYTSGFFMLIAFAIVGFILSGFIGAMILWASAGVNMKDLSTVMKDPQYAATLRVVQSVSLIITMFLPAWLTATVLNRRPFRLLGFRKEADLSQIILVIGIMFTALFVAGAFGSLNKDIADALGLKGWSEKLERSYNEQVKTMLDMDSTAGYLISIFIMAFLPAVCEEVLFRGGLQNFLSRATKKPWLSIVIVSLLFSLVHFSAYGLLPRFFLGIMLGAIFHYTKNIWLSITGHFFNNALAVSTIYLFMKQGKPMKEALEKDISFAYWGFLALPLIVWLLLTLKKNAARSEYNAPEKSE